MEDKTRELILRKNALIEGILKSKLLEMSRQAFEDGNYYLTDMLRDLANSGKVVIMEELKKDGYELDYAYSENDFELKHDDIGRPLITINPDKVKVTLKKLLYDL
jgi:hypothetical protein